jgi:hypothetical protein
VTDGFGVGRALHRLLSCLLEIMDRFFAIPTVTVMMGKLTIVVLEPLAKYLFDSPSGALVEHPPLL